jgi:hypothetical protein
MKRLSLLVIIAIFFSCNAKKEDFNYQTSIGAKVYQAQISYLNNTLSNYSRISEKGLHYYREDVYFDSLADLFKDKVKRGQPITENDKSAFYSHFEETFTGNQLINPAILNDLKALPVTAVSDVDLLRLYVKNSLVCILLNNKLLPFDSWSIMTSAEKWTINDGETFVAQLGNLASNPSQPNYWFVMKEGSDTLIAENIIDTLHEDERGTVYFETSNYKKGKNTVTIFAKMNAPGMDHHVIKTDVEFYVK